jgi:hypothetical protein
MGYNDDYDGFDDFDDRGQGSNSNGPADLRKAYNALKKKFSDLETAHQTVSGQLAQRNLRDVLADKGLRPGLARVIAKEDVDLTDSAAVEAWLSDPANQEDFAFSVEGGGADGTSGAASSNDGSDQGAGGDHSDYAAKLARLQGASNGAMPDDKVAVAHTQIQQAKTPEDLQAALNAAIKQL